MAKKITPPNDQILKTLTENLNQLQRRIVSACERSGRNAEEIHLVAVTKYADWAWVQTLAELHDQFGENRPQQLIDRQQQLPSIQWHLIGQLQRNKVRSVLPHCGLIHSIDSIRLFDKLADVARELSLRPQFLMQINVSGEQSKSGLTVAEFREAWNHLIQRHADVQLQGLMTMAPANQDPDQARDTFRGLCELRDSMLSGDHQLPESWTLSELSMGMSGDFEIAIEEGATIVRVGSAIFEGLEPSAN